MASVYEQALHDAWYGKPVPGGLEERCRATPSGCDASDLARARLLDGIGASTKKRENEAFRNKVNDTVYALGKNLPEDMQFKSNARIGSPEFEADLAKHRMHVEQMKNAPVMETYDWNKSVGYNPSLEKISDAIQNTLLGYESPKYNEIYEKEHANDTGLDIAKDMAGWMWSPTAIAKTWGEMKKGYVPGLIDVVDILPVAGAIGGLVKGAKQLYNARAAGRSLKNYRRAQKAGKKWCKANSANPNVGEEHWLEYGGVDPNDIMEWVNTH